jgi:catechol 2,3-dioxygenase-like lactoylglutathione lyase family enzyme
LGEGGTPPVMLSVLPDAYIVATPPPGAERPTRSRAKSVTFFVTDLARSVAFYRDMLGFRETPAGRGSSVLERDDARVVLRKVAASTVDRSLVQLLLEVPDVRAAYDDLQARGTSFIHRPRPLGHYEQMTLWSTAFLDPDGHGVAATQWLPTR